MPLPKKQIQVNRAMAKKALKTLAKPVVKFGRKMIQVNKDVNAAYKYGARP